MFTTRNFDHMVSNLEHIGKQWTRHQQQLSPHRRSLARLGSRQEQNQPQKPLQQPSLLLWPLDVTWQLRDQNLMAGVIKWLSRTSPKVSMFLIKQICFNDGCKGLISLAFWCCRWRRSRSSNRIQLLLRDRHRAWTRHVGPHQSSHTGRRGLCLDLCLWPLRRSIAIGHGLGGGNPVSCQL